MTGQMHDRVFYAKEEYALVGMKGEILPTPLDFGMETEMMSTACYRGYIASYEAIDNQLTLFGIVIQAKNGTDYKPIYGVQPEIREGWHAARYSDLKMPINFSGGLLVAQDFIEDMYVHMGFQKPPAYRTVIELWFDKGRLTRVADYSEKAAQIRAAMQKSSDPDGRMTLFPIWVEQRFSLDYDFD